MRKNIYAPKKRTSLGTLSRQAKKIAEKIAKFDADVRMNIDAIQFVKYSEHSEAIKYFTTKSVQLNELYQEQCKQKGR